ncbi:hypothetical protein HDC92_002195 [Pedobacter sp. AK017]|uniref:hypothetical protein n=1 Tax=Pedobacter sp. AK017 TaxID=2723073 RepID=UPI001612CB7B|nr:hypothetical protein [Pedobacter sp. AK017]MBB5438519.1 hypothetical protein [Pedobacter sp. AK017]
MKTHTTKTLRELVLNVMDSEKHQMSPHEIEVWLQTMPEITREMFEALHFFTSHLFNKTMICRQLQQIHKECIYLLDKIDKMGVLAAEMETLRLAVIKCLDQIVGQLLGDYSKYLEFDILMPLRHLRSEQLKLTSGMKAVQVLFDMLSVSAKFQQVILTCMIDVQKSSRCFYERMVYVQALQEGLLELCKRSHKSCITADLLLFLVERNYNTEAFIAYYKKVVVDDLVGMVEENDQLKYLERLERDLASRPYRKFVFCYDHRRSRARDVLHAFVQSELDMRQRVAEQRRKAEMEAFRASQTVKARVEGSGAGTVTAQLPVYKIHTPLSVDALAYLFKLLITAKVIEPGVKTELFAFLAGIFQTPGTGLNGISPGSFETKYKQVVQSTARTVRVLLIRMLKMLDEEFGLG